VGVLVNQRHREVGLIRPGFRLGDGLFFIKQVLKRCRGDPVVLVDRGPWYNWPLDDLNLCESRRETWGNGLWLKRG
jgi:hypothetical protein